MVEVPNISKDLEKEIKDRLDELYQTAEELKSKDLKKWERILNSKKNPNPDMEEISYSEKDLIKKVKDTKERSLIKYIPRESIDELSRMAQLKSSIDGNKSLFGRLIG